MPSKGKEKTEVLDIPPLLLPGLPATSNYFSAQGISYTLFCNPQWVRLPSAFPVSPWSSSISFLHWQCSPPRRSATACVNYCHCCVVLNQAPISFHWRLLSPCVGAAGSSQSPPVLWACWRPMSATGCSIPAHPLGPRMATAPGFDHPGCVSLKLFQWVFFFLFFLEQKSFYPCSLYVLVGLFLLFSQINVNAIPDLEIFHFWEKTSLSCSSSYVLLQERIWCSATSNIH